MSEMVERVARAIDKALNPGGSNSDNYLYAAQEAIAAMREPTEEMLICGDLADHSHRGEAACLGRIYPAMIEAALKD